MSDDNFNLNYRNQVHGNPYILKTCKPYDVFPLYSFDVVPGDTIEGSLSLQVKLPALKRPLVGEAQIYVGAYYVPKKLVQPHFPYYLKQQIAKYVDHTKLNPAAQAMLGVSGFNTGRTNPTGYADGLRHWGFNKSSESDDLLRINAYSFAEKEYLHSTLLKQPGARFQNMMGIPITPVKAEDLKAYNHLRHVEKTRYNAKEGHDETYYADEWETENINYMSMQILACWPSTYRKIMHDFFQSPDLQALYQGIPESDRDPFSNLHPSTHIRDYHLRILPADTNQDIFKNIVPDPVLVDDKKVFAPVSIEGLRLDEIAEIYKITNLKHKLDDLGIKVQHGEVTQDNINALLMYAIYGVRQDELKQLNMSEFLAGKYGSIDFGRVTAMTSDRINNVSPGDQYGTGAGYVNLNLPRRFFDDFGTVMFVGFVLPKLSLLDAWPRAVLTPGNYGSKEFNTSVQDYMSGYVDMDLPGLSNLDTKVQDVYAKEIGLNPLTDRPNDASSTVVGYQPVGAHRNQFPDSIGGDHLYSRGEHNDSSHMGVRLEQFNYDANSEAGKMGMLHKIGYTTADYTGHKDSTVVENLAASTSDKSKIIKDASIRIANMGHDPLTSKINYPLADSDPFSLIGRIYIKKLTGVQKEEFNKSIKFNPSNNDMEVTNDVAKKTRKS